MKRILLSENTYRAMMDDYTEALVLENKPDSSGEDHETAMLMFKNIAEQLMDMCEIV